MGFNEAQAEQELDLARGDLPTGSAGRGRGGRGWTRRAQELAWPRTAPAHGRGEMKRCSTSRGRRTPRSRTRALTCHPGTAVTDNHGKVVSSQNGQLVEDQALLGNERI